MAVKDYYQLLGVEREASDEEIKKAYRRLVLTYHPDRNKDNPDCEEIIKDLNEAYHVLGNQEKRRQYDILCQQLFNNYMYYQENLSDDLLAILRAFSRGGVGMKGFGGCRGMGLGKKGCRRCKN